MKSDSSCLEALARKMISVQRTNRAPVLVVPSNLVLRRAFLLALCVDLTAALQRQAESRQPTLAGLRIDWIRCASVWSPLLDPLARRWARRLSASISGESGLATEVQLTTTISRPPAHSEQFVFGLADAGTKLTAWSCPIFLQAACEQGTATATIALGGVQ